MLELYYLIAPFYRLSGRRQHARPKNALRIYPLLLANRERNRNVDKGPVQKPYHQIRLTRHRGVDRIPGQQVT